MVGENHELDVSPHVELENGEYRIKYEYLASLKDEMYEREKHKAGGRDAKR